MRNKAFSLIRLKIKRNIKPFKGGIEKTACLYTLFLPFSIKNLRLFFLDCFSFPLDSRLNFFNRIDSILFFSHQAKVDSDFPFTINISTPLDPESINNFFILVIINANIPESYSNVPVIQ